MVYFLILVLGLLPFFLVPYFFNPLITSKFLLLTVASFTVFFTLIFSVLRYKQISLHITPIFWPLILFATSVLVSSLTNQQYPDKQLLGFGGILLMLSGVVLVMPSIIKGDYSTKVMSAINWSGAILGLFSIAQVFGFGIGDLIGKISILTVPNTLAFSLAGSAIVMVQILSAILIADIADRKHWQSSWLNRLLMLVIAIALGVNIRAVLPGGQATFSSLPIGASLEIAKNSLYITKTAFFGYGPDSYSNAYNILKPLWLNNASYWQSSFDFASNLPLTFVVTIGAVGCIFWLWLLYRTVVSAWRTQVASNSLKYFVVALVIWQFILPVGPVFLGLFFITLAFMATADDKATKIKNYSFAFFNQQGERHQLVDRVLITVMMLLAGLTTFALVSVGRSYIASYHVYQASAALIGQNTVQAYDSWQRAAQVAPRLDFLRRSYAMVNLEIAIALSNKTDITPAEQEQVVQLVNQALREAKAAAALDPSNYQNWLALAQIYTQLIESSEQASQEAFNAFASAVSVNPNDPSLRLSLGQLFMGLEKPNDAIVFFNQAIERKPDLVQAHYALAQALQQVKAYDEAEQALIATLALLEEGSEEHTMVKEEIEAVKEAKTKSLETTTPTEQQEQQSAPAAESNNSGLSEVLDSSATDEMIRDQALENDLAL